MQCYCFHGHILFVRGHVCVRKFASIMPGIVSTQGMYNLLIWILLIVKKMTKKSIIIFNCTVYTWRSFIVMCCCLTTGHLFHKFGISESDWYRIKQSIDSKCRTAWRRKQRGQSLAVKSFSKRTPRGTGSGTVCSFMVSNKTNWYINATCITPYDLKKKSWWT